MKKFLLLLLVQIAFIGLTYAAAVLSGSPVGATVTQTTHSEPNNVYYDGSSYDNWHHPYNYNYIHNPYYRECATTPQGVFYNINTRSYQYFPIGSPLNGYCRVSGTVYIPKKRNGFICMNRYTYEVVDCENNLLEPELMACLDSFTNKFKECPKF